MIALLPAVVVTAWVAVWLAGFLAEDSCLDSGGAVLNGLCHLGEGRVEALDYSFTRMGWLVFGALASIPGIAVYYAAGAIGRRIGSVKA
jgi:hypothetical protein